MQGLLETPGLTVAGHLVHGQVKEAPHIPLPADANPGCKSLPNCVKTHKRII